MSNSRAHPIALTAEQVVWEKISKLKSIYDQRTDGMIPLEELDEVPTFIEIFRSKGFDSVRKKFPGIDSSQLRDMDTELQQYILNRYLDEVESSTTDKQRAECYTRVIGAFNRYGIDASTYLARISDKAECREAQWRIKEGAAAYVKEKLAVAFNTARLLPEDKDVIESVSASPNEKLESLLRPFNIKAADPWLTVLQQAGYDYGDAGLTEAIKPDNAYTNTLMVFDQQAAQPA